MFSFFKRRKPAAGSAAPDFEGSHEHDPEWLRLRNQYADPAIELATTKQAVIVSAASVLDRIWNANGGASWDESREEDYIAPLREHLLDPAVFSAEECAAISERLDRIAAVGRRNSRIEETAAEHEAEDVFFEPIGTEVNYLVSCAIAWCRHFPEPIALREEDEYRGHF